MSPAVRRRPVFSGSTPAPCVLPQSLRVTHQAWTFGHPTHGAVRAFEILREWAQSTRGKPGPGRRTCARVRLWLWDLDLGFGFGS